MNAPRPGHGKNFCVRWISTSGETLYTTPTYKREAERLIQYGRWHPKAQPTLHRLK